MPLTHNSRAKFSHGFTLLEIMVVMVIFGIMVSLVSVSFSGQSPEQKLEVESKKFSSIFELVAEYGLLNNLELGLKVERNGYEFLVFNNKTWSPIAEQELFKQTLPEGMLITLELDDLPIDDEQLFESGNTLFDEPSSFDEIEEVKKKLPQVFIFSGGDFTPFKLTFTYAEQYSFDEEIEYHIIGLYTLPLKSEGPIFDGIER